MYKMTYYPWITQHIDPKEISRQIRRFADVLQVELKKAKASTVDIEVLPPLEVPLQIAAIANGACQIALMNPLGYVFARTRNTNIAAIVLAQRIIDGKVGDVYGRLRWPRRSRRRARRRDHRFGRPIRLW